MPFEVFTHHSTRAARGSTVTITARGGLTLSADAYHLLAEPSHVDLLFDVDTQTIALRASAADSTNAYPVRQQGKSFLVSGTAFARFNGIDTSRSRRWPARMEDGMLQFTLTDQAASVTSNRRKRT